METLKGFRVFIASPGGLDEERRTFRRTLLEINEDDAFDRGIVLVPVGWELTLGGVGRPQEKVNSDIKRCDYLVLVLWDRWGTPPSDTGEFTSGTEEEHAVAMECMRDPGLPMRDVVVMFKGVSTRQLSDPGTQLSKVLAFKQRLESEKDVLYTTFDSVDEFRRHVDRHARRWLRDEEPERRWPTGDSAAVAREVTGAGPIDPAQGDTDRSDGEPQPDPAAPEPGGSDGTRLAATAANGSQAESDLGALIAEANALANDRRFSEAEELYARAVVGRTDRDALAAYGRFLRRMGRFEKATEISSTLLKDARRAGDVKAQIEALSNIAIVHRKRGRLAQASGEIAQAVELAESLGDDGLDDLAFLLDNEGQNARKRGRFREALAEHNKALDIRQRSKDEKSIAKSYNNISPLLRQLGELDEALEMQNAALATFEPLRYSRGLAPGYANRGEIYELQGEFELARGDYELSLRYNEQVGSPEGIGMNLMELGRLALKTGDEVTAREFAERGLAGEDSANRPEGMANATQLLGLVLAAEGDFKGAMDRLKHAAETYGSCDHVIGLVYTLCDLAEVELRAGLYQKACGTVERASRTFVGVEHVQLSERLEALTESARGLRDAV